MRSAAEMVWIFLNADKELNLDSKKVRAFVSNAAIVLDVIWFTRNDVVHNSVLVDTREMVKAKSEGIWSILLLGLEWKEMP